MTKFLSLAVAALLVANVANAQGKKIAEPMRKGGEAKAVEAAKKAGESATREVVKPGSAEAAGKVLQFKPKTPEISAEQAAANRARAFGDTRTTEQRKASAQEYTERALRYLNKELGANAVVAGSAEFRIVDVYGKIRAIEGETLTLSLAKIAQIIKESKASGESLDGVANTFERAHQRLVNKEARNMIEALEKEVDQKNRARVKECVAA